MTAARSEQSISGVGIRARACRKLPLVSSLVGRVGLSSLRATGTFLLWRSRCGSVREDRGSRSRLNGKACPRPRHQSRQRPT